MTIANLAGFENIPQSIPSFCLESFRRNSARNVLSHKIGDSWRHITGSEAFERVRRIAIGLAELGVKAGDRIGIISENRPEWSLVDLAILSLRAVNVPIYTTQAVDQIRFILENSGARMLFISGKKIHKHAENALQSVERLERVIYFDEDAAPPDDKRAITLAEIEKTGGGESEDSERSFDKMLADVRPEDLATIIYTSGTTGEPKGVMLTHRNFVSNVRSISGGLPIRPTDCSLAVLPLSHIFERTVFYVL
jgi:long-chain acyl-CoA synthetase